MADSPGSVTLPSEVYGGLFHRAPVERLTTHTGEDDIALVAVRV